MRKKQDKEKKPRTIKLADKTWENFLMLKSRDDKSWDLYITELIELINRIKNL